VKQVLVRSGKVVVEEVPAPVCRPGHILVRLLNSCISAGTEMAGVRSSGKPLYRRAMEKPEQVKKALDMVAAKGIGQTWEFVNSRLYATNPTGYSASGIVVEAGKGISDFRPGELVAVAGAGIANHAELVCVPRNLCVSVPEGLDADVASTVTLGAIALQGVRRANPTLGESFVVVGLGILGQMTVQLLRANGCRVIGTDLDMSRISLARELGMEGSFHPADGPDTDQVARLTGGVGADGVIITASSPSDEILSHAFAMCRKKGRVVLVGDVGLNIRREDIYVKELDFLISTSYGPGRYDASYEDEGLDYPVGYVRWTENRNMAEYLRLLSAGRLQIKPLISSVHDITAATEAYASLEKAGEKPLIALLSYPSSVVQSAPVRKVPNPGLSAAASKTVTLALVGAGNFSKDVHLPNIKALKGAIRLRAVMDAVGHNASAVARQYGAEYSTTEFRQLLDDDGLDAVMISTRHNTHAALALQALKAGKHVFVEKPLSMTREDLDRLVGFYGSAKRGGPVLMTGFNRRFSKYAVACKRRMLRRVGPMMIDYRMNAGYIPLDHWVHGSEGGGRNIGEACHIYDLFTFLTGAAVANVSAGAVSPAAGYYSRRDNFTATVSFSDGSLATLTYTAMGARDYPKERMDIFFDGKVISLDDYRSMTAAGFRMEPLSSKASDKGHREELEAFIAAVRQGGEWPIPLWEQVQATEIALAVEKSL
jgi:predicted dehydrogenase/threonine dehydrogenase-like Zn-dependent dehydrogenase